MYPEKTLYRFLELVYKLEKRFHDTELQHSLRKCTILTYYLESSAYYQIENYHLVLRKIISYNFNC